jgi:hypothetical protein
VVFGLFSPQATIAVQPDKSLPYGRFPSPASRPDDDVPLLPFGGYWKLECCEDRELYEHTLRATLYQMRQLGMNTAVLDPGQSKSPWVLDIMHSIPGGR